MDDLTFNNLAVAIQRRGGGLPAVKCQELRDMLEELFSEEEARLACLLPETPAFAGDLAAQTGYSLEQVEGHLESMAGKGLLFSTKIGDKRTYLLFGLAPSIVENQLLTGIVNDRTKKFARLLRRYYKAITQKGKGASQLFSKVPFARIIAIDQNIPDGTAIMPYDKLLPYIDKARYISRVVCHCRQMGELLDYPCSKPKDVCLAVGDVGHYLAEYGLGKPITREEAYKTLERAEEAGLVHSVSNTGQEIGFICNCCTCHCELLKSLKKSVKYGAAAVSSFISSVNSEECIGCGDCIPRCPMEAIILQNEMALVDEKHCIGCGLCVSVCPSKAIAMRSRADKVIPYDDAKLLNKAIADSMSGKES